jgi:hypothetical protein
MIIFFDLIGDQGKAVKTQARSTTLAYSQMAKENQGIGSDNSRRRADAMPSDFKIRFSDIGLLK